MPYSLPSADGVLPLLTPAFHHPWDIYPISRSTVPIGRSFFWGFEHHAVAKEKPPNCHYSGNDWTKRVYSCFNACGNYTLCTLSIFHVVFPFGVKWPSQWMDYREAGTLFATDGALFEWHWTAKYGSNDCTWIGQMITRGPTQPVFGGIRCHKGVIPRRIT